MTSSATRRLWLLIAFIVAADQATKHWALNRLSNAF